MEEEEAYRLLEELICTSVSVQRPENILILNLTLR